MSTPLPPCPGGFIYTVRPGDTLFGLARRFNMAVTALLAANPDLDPAQNPEADPNRLVIGQQLCIPAPPPPTCPGILYTVRTGDTLFNLARRFNTTVEAILAANPGLDPENLPVGQEICLPVPAPPCRGFYHTVGLGETVYGLARRFGTTVEAILAANPGLVPERMVVGQRICIPLTAET